MCCHPFSPSKTLCTHLFCQLFWNSFYILTYNKQIKNLYVPENIVGKFLHSCKYFRGICKSIKNDIFGLENNLYLHYSHKGVIVRVEETISKLQNWHTCKNFRGTLPCNLSKCAVFHT